MRSRIFSSSQFPISLLLFGILFLFFFQLLTDFIEAIYAFGLLGTSIPPEIAAVLFLFTPLLLLFGRLNRPALVVFGELALLCRAVEPLLDTRSRMLVSGLGVGLLLLLIPGLLWMYAQRGETGRAGVLGNGLGFGLALSILFHGLHSGLDLSIARGFEWIGWLLALPAGILLPIILATPRGAAGPWAAQPASKQSTPRKAARGREPAPAPTGNLVLLVLGLISILILIYFAFANPAVIARWTEGRYPIILFLLVLGLVVFAAYAHPLATLAPSAFAGVNLVFVFSLVGTIFTNQVVFPANAGGYPLQQPAAPGFSGVFLSVALVTAPILILDFTRLTGALLTVRPSVRRLGVSFSLGALYLLVMIFAHVFTTVYDYIPVAGPWFRDRFWLVHLLPGLILILALLRTPAGRPVTQPRAYLGGVALAGLLAVGGALAGTARPPAPPEKASLRVLTYNIQQGYRDDGQRGAADQLAVLRAQDADLIGLQESDTARISGGNADIVRYFADQLDLYAYYGPRTATGTFGIALLSKYPLEDPRTFFMYSAGEQTAAIHAQVAAAGQIFNVFVTHLGNGGPLIQQQQFLQEVGQLLNVIAMGDFNFEPSTEQYRLTDLTLDDAWLLKWPSGVDDQGYNPADRIDHIFLSSGLEVVTARHLTGPESDHPAVVVDIRP